MISPQKYLKKLEGNIVDPEDVMLPCADKMVFDTQKEAAASANVVEWQHGAKVKPYLCNHCDLWHLSSHS